MLIGRLGSVQNKAGSIANLTFISCVAAQIPKRRAKAEQERAKLPKITSLFQQAAKVDSNVTADASAVSSPPDPATASNPSVSSESRQTDSPAAPLQPSELAVPHASRQRRAESERILTLNSRLEDEEQIQKGRQWEK
ncbi:hypothetical protein SKAU_G00276820 [Synaphobranchus kaupii]|uniref:Uncharacterized protein n=1 Tax=Synaphobranchus kaupii TaxID=118154 RepID=A0A9Q1IP48_SYNKA|nr:hypothetical protein SKAU_G00276820 [Synaphobranchus kaupii]